MSTITSYMCATITGSQDKTLFWCFGPESTLSSHVNTDLLCRSVRLPLQDLYAAGEGKFGTDEEKFITILGNRSAEHLTRGERVPACLSRDGHR